LENCGLEMASEFDRFGLRSSSDSERLIGQVGVARCTRFVGGAGLLEASEDHGGTGGLVRLGDKASFLEGCGLWLEDGVVAQSLPVCWGGL